MTKSITITALGCSGPVAAHIVDGFLAIPNVEVKLLARTPEAVHERYNNAKNLTVVKGSMANPEDVATATKAADLAFLITPMGKNNDPTMEVEMARKTLQGCQQGKLKHLVYASVLNPKANTGVGILDAKYDVEQLIQDSKLPFSILRCGSYMEDVFNPRLSLLQKGFFLFPVDKDQRFNYTAQCDIPPFIVEHLLPHGPLNSTLDFIEPNTYTVEQVEQVLTKAAGYRIRTVPRMPFLYLFKLLLPIFRLMEHRLSSVIPLVDYFDQHGYTGDSMALQGSQYKSFSMTSVEGHLSNLLESSNKEN